MRLNILAFVLGVWLLQHQAVLPGVSWALLLFLPLGAALGSARAGWRRPSRLAWGLLFCAAGFFWAAWLAQQRLADALPRAWEGRDIQLVGVVSGLPDTTGNRSRFTFTVERVETPGAKTPRHLRLSWYAPRRRAAQRSSPPRLAPGERWRLTVRLKRPHGDVNPYGFDYEAWLLEHDLRATGYIRARGVNRRLDARAARPDYWMARLRWRIAQRFDAVLGQRPDAGILKALAIGDRSAITRQQWTLFARTGVTHLMSISGLHITLAASLFGGLVFWGWRRSARLSRRLPARKAAVAAGLLAALGYAWLTGFGVPAQRTAMMAAVAAAAIWRGRPVAASRVLAAALFLVVLFDPWAVLAPGFWLSFGAVAIIFFVTTGRIGRISGLRQWGIVQWAITLGLSPLLLALFYRVSLVSPVANAIAIPLVGWIVTPLALAGMVPPLGFLLSAADSVMTIGMAALRFLSELPVAVWQPHAPPVWTIAAALAGAFWLLLPRGFPARWLGLAGMLPLFLVAPPRPAPGELWVTVLDVGQGLAVVARSRSHALLFDAGPRYGGGADSGNRVIMPFLRASGIGRLDGVVISHNDEDHLGGAASVLDAEPVGWIASSLPDRHPLLARPILHWRCQAGERWTWDGVRFTFLSPAPSSYGRPASDNARSCVLKISAAGGNILLAADIPRRIEAGLVAHDRVALRSTVLVAPHHGSKSSSSRVFVRQVMPAVVVFSSGYRNRFGHPAPQIVARYRAVGSRPYRTDQDGAIILRFSRAGVETGAGRQQQRRYWR